MFQSTPARERATGFRQLARYASRCFNPRPLASGRPDCSPDRSVVRGFNPRPLASGRLARYRARTGIDVGFNPRPLASGRPRSSVELTTCWKFQSTPARERATSPSSLNALMKNVSIHARSRAGDISLRVHALRVQRFNPRPLASGRRRHLPNSSLARWFQSTPARERATL